MQGFNSTDGINGISGPKGAMAVWLLELIELSEHAAAMGWVSMLQLASCAKLITLADTRCTSH